jgi:hypothetical protein
MRILVFHILLVCPVLASFAVDSFWVKERSHKVEDNWISVLKIAERIAKLEEGKPDYAVIPVAAIRHRNKKASKIDSLYLCVHRSGWGDYEIEKPCRIRFLDSVKDVRIPKGENWLFESEDDLAKVKSHLRE